MFVVLFLLMYLYPTLQADYIIPTNTTKYGRLLTNPFGLLGHHSCSSNDFLIGQCYNEMECIIRGGAFSGYCHSPLNGACCVFHIRKCNRIVNEKIVYFSNPSYPQRDSAPGACPLRIRPRKDICWIRIELKDFILPAIGGPGKCQYNALTIINSATGLGGSICGIKNGYSYVVKAPAKGDLDLNVLAQGPHYKWHIKITQIECDKVKPLPRDPECGMSGVQEVSASFEKSALYKRFRVKKKRTNKKWDECSILPNCPANNWNIDSPLLQRKLAGEAYYPAFSIRKSFCDSKFQKDEPTSKILNGEEAPVGGFPWLVSMKLRGNHFCGGALITAQWIVTAAHCVEFGNLKTFLSEVTINLGDHDLSTTEEANHVERSAAAVLIYPTWFNHPGAPGDFALIRLDSPAPISPTIATICLPKNPDESFERIQGIVAGWGVTETGNISEKLKTTELNIISYRECKSKFRNVGIRLLPDMMCTLNGPTGDETVCSGDSGSPLMVRSGGRFVVVGVVSFSLSDCTAPFPAVYSRITYFMEWMAAALTSM